MFFFRGAVLVVRANGLEPGAVRAMVSGIPGVAAYGIPVPDAGGRNRDQPVCF